MVDPLKKCTKNMYNFPHTKFSQSNCSYDFLIIEIHDRMKSNDCYISLNIMIVEYFIRYISIFWISHLNKMLEKKKCYLWHLEQLCYNPTDWCKTNLTLFDFSKVYEIMAQNGLLRDVRKSHRSKVLWLLKRYNHVGAFFSKMVSMNRNFLIIWLYWGHDYVFNFKSLIRWHVWRIYRHIYGESAILNHLT